MHKLRLGLKQICFNVPYHVNSSKIDESKNLTTNNITKIFFFIKKKKLNIDGIFKEQFSKKKKPDITSIRYDIKTYVITLLAQIHVLVTMQWYLNSNNSKHKCTCVWQEADNIQMLKYTYRAILSPSSFTLPLSLLHTFILDKLNWYCTKRTSDKT